MLFRSTGPAANETTSPSHVGGTFMQLRRRVLTLVLVGFGWFLFRAGATLSWDETVAALQRWHAPVWAGQMALNLAVLLTPLVALDVWRERTQDPFAALRLTGIPRAALLGFLLLSVVLFWPTEAPRFIYFQF